MPTQSSINAWMLAAIGSILLFASLRSTTESMIATWLSSETFSHGLFVLPAFLWLVYRERQALATCPHVADRLPLSLCLPVGLFWLISQVAGVIAGEQLALTLLLILIIWSAIGRKAAALIAYPLGFLLFLAPLGEELVPQLMELTAELTTFAIELTGIPIYREGLFFSLPSGNWSVVAACSGIRYLITSMALGYLYAHFTYKSIYRKAAFMALAIVVPLVANSIRAFGIVMIGHFSGMTLATGVDHLIYGWLFFGMVMFVLFTLGALFREKPSSGASEKDVVQGDHRRSMDDKGREPLVPTEKDRMSTATYLIALSMCIMVWPAWAAAIAIKAEAHEPSRVSAIHAAEQGSAVTLNEISTEPEEWRPVISGHDRFVGKRHFNTATQSTVDALAYAFDTQTHGKEMVNAMNRLVSGKDSPWRRVEQTIKPTESPTLPGVQQSRLRSAHGTLLVWHWYQVGSEHTSSPIKAKLLETRDRLLLRSRPSVAWFLSTDASSQGAELQLQSALDQVLRSK